jgi:hypothetical protein
MTVFGYVKHASVEVLGAVSCLIGEQLQDTECSGVLDGIERTHESSNG